MKRYLVRILAGAMILNAITLNLNAQEVDSLNIDLQVSKIQAVLENLDDIGFNMVYSIEVHDSGMVTIDSITAYCKIDSNRFLIAADSTKQIFNKSYSVTINQENKTMYVTSPVFNAKAVMQLDILDPIFRDSYVDSMFIRDTGTYKMIVVAFKPQAPFSEYRLMYTTQSVQPVLLTYTVRRGKTVGQAAIFDDFTTITVRYQNYAPTTLGDADFSTDSYFIRRNGVFIIKSAYSDYTLINDYDSSAVTVEGSLN